MEKCAGFHTGIVGFVSAEVSILMVADSLKAMG